jgi:tetratricopeptide (TPR) repeat protein
MERSAMRILIGESGTFAPWKPISYQAARKRSSRSSCAIGRWVTSKQGGTTVEFKSELIELLKLVNKGEQALYDMLTEDERSIVGEPDGWSPKDVIVHVAGWKGRLAENLAAAGAGETPVRQEDYEAVNAAEFEENQHRPWPEVLEMAGEATRQLMEQVEARSEDELRGTETLPWQGDRPLWRLIVGIGCIHPLAYHLGPIYLERGEVERATELQEEAARRLSELDPADGWHGLVLYNLACHYALAGDRKGAIERLGKALELTPELTEHSKEDPDLACLREESAYQELYAE